MKLYKTTITPTSNFATTLKGDTLFGQMCWVLRYKFGNERLAEMLKEYEKKPFLIVSDGFAKGYLPKPKMPGSLLGEEAGDKKANRKKIWLKPEDLESGNFTAAGTDEEISRKDASIVTIRNSINYKTFATGDEGNFAPYGDKEIYLSQKDLYFLLDEEQLDMSELKESFTLLSQMGYGKDSTIGKGRFDIGELEEVKSNTASKTFMTLSPFSPQNMEYEDIYYEPFTRFGKSGAGRANTNPFKKPILLADTGAVVDFKSKQELKHIGKAIKNISTYSDIVHQGYSIVVPIKDIS